MAISEDQILQWKHAYQVLGVPLSASAPSIKQAYRQLVKRWHPDLYKIGTDEYAESTQMATLINEAYGLVQDAPLRYHVDAFPLRPPSARQEATAKRYSPDTSRTTPPKTDRLEFWVRFVCGTIFGAFFGIRLFFYFYQQPWVFLLGVLGISVLFGFAAARGGDKFWHANLGRWWMWW